MKFISMSLAISLIFSPFASIMAFLITYGEYLHHYPDKKRPVRLAIQAAAATFMFFMALALAIGFVLENMIGA
jgi:hypothetical protein